MKKAFPLIALMGAALLSCAPLEPANSAAGLDLVPPVLARTLAAAADRIELTFDEPPVLRADSPAIEPDLTVTGSEVSDKTIVIHTAPGQTIGREYRLRVTVADASGNSAWLIVRFYGFNPAPPRLLINEFITQGSATHPDLVELKAIAGGNLGGVTFYNGTARLNKSGFVFPAFEVRPGDFILLHLKPQLIPAEIDETAARNLSGGLDASAEAFDFWVKDGTGLSGNNGVLSLYTQPDGDILDAVLYSTRASDSDADYRGFGSFDLRDQADELCAGNAWTAAGAQPAPEDAVNPSQSTATRSIGRSSQSRDTNAKGDWHVVPTKKASFGRENSDEVYLP